jgi:hypothetical protein
MLVAKIETLDFLHVISGVESEEILDPWKLQAGSDEVYERMWLYHLLRELRSPYLSNINM